ALLLQEAAQVRAVAVDRVGDDPADRQTGSLGALNHPLGQFRFGLKGDRLGDMGGVSTRQIGTPVLGQVQLAVDESMTTGGDVGEKDADLAVFDTPGEPAILGSDASGVAAAFGKAAFVKDQDREERLVLR